MATTSLDAITAAEVKAYHGITSTDYDAKIAVILPLVADWIEQYCGHDFLSTTRTAEKPIVDEYTKTFFLKYKPVASVTSLTEDGQSLTENTDYFVDKDTGAVTKYIDTSSVFSGGSLGGYWTTEPNQISITYVGGEALTQDVVLVFYELCGIYAGLKVRTYTTNEGVEQAVALMTLPDNMYDILNKHRWRVA